MGFQSKKQSANGMQYCPNCDSILVQPGNLRKTGAGHWDVELRCPECEWGGRGNYSQTEVERFSDELDRGDRELIEDLRALIRANMEGEADRLAAALATDGILPEDFHAGPDLA